MECFDRHQLASPQGDSGQAYQVNHNQIHIFWDQLTQNNHHVHYGSAVQKD